MAIRSSITTLCVTLVVSLGVSQVGLSVVQATPQGSAAQAAPEPHQANLQEMTRMHDQMMAEMKAGDAKLDALVKDMNAAASDTKVAAIVAVVNELIRQQKAMHNHMGQMHQHMMGGHGAMMRR